MVVEAVNPAGIPVVARVTEIRMDNRPSHPGIFKGKYIVTVNATVPEDVSDELVQFYQSLTIVQGGEVEVNRSEFDTIWSKAYGSAKEYLERIKFTDLIDA